jgi:hypothetical protein
MTTTDIGDALLQAPITPALLEQSGWNDLVDAAQQLRDQITIADAQLASERKQRLAEMAPRTAILKEMEARLDAVRAHLKQRAVESFAQYREMGKTFGGVQLREQHRLIVEDLDAAADLLAAVELIDAEAGALVPLVQWKPVLDERAVMLFIRALEEDPKLWPVPAFRLGADAIEPDAADTFNREARGWPGILRATRRDDPASYALVVQREPEPGAQEGEGR